jgi:putative ABC transport system ATP-binding protein
MNSPGHNSGTPMIAATALTKIYTRGREEVRALDQASFEVSSGEFIAVTGPSGSGKTTLLNLIGCMDNPSSGTLKINGRDVHAYSERERTAFRREQIGFVFQHFGLLPTLTVSENIALPLLFSGRAAGSKIDQLLERVGLQHRRTHRPHELSGGEMQRVAIARALVNEPALLLADEPTGNLDSAMGEGILDLFRQLHSDGLTVIVVTHNLALAAVSQRQIALKDGRGGAQV